MFVYKCSHGHTFRLTLILMQVLGQVFPYDTQQDKITLFNVSLPLKVGSTHPRKNMGENRPALTHTHIAYKHTHALKYSAFTHTPVH